MKEQFTFLNEDVKTLNTKIRNNLINKWAGVEESVLKRESTNDQ
jgi:hypothetical protein